MREARNLFYHFFKECVYSDIRIVHRNELAKGCVEFLFNFFEKFYSGNTELLPMHIQDELDSNPKWWHTYDKRTQATGQVSETIGIAGKGAHDTAISCKLAAMDIVADLTDREALATAEALNKAESTAAMEVLDRILSTFPNRRQVNLNQARQSATHQELSSLLPVAGD